MAEQYYEGIGRRKASTARVRVMNGTGEFTVNEKSLTDFFTRPGDAETILAPLETVGRRNSLDVSVLVQGGEQLFALDGVAFPGVDGRDHAVFRRHDLHNDLVRFDFDDKFIAGDGLTFLLVPGGNLAVRLAQPRGTAGHLFVLRSSDRTGAVPAGEHFQGLKHRPAPQVRQALLELDRILLRANRDGPSCQNGAGVQTRRHVDYADAARPITVPEAPVDRGRAPVPG